LKVKIKVPAGGITIPTAISCPCCALSASNRVILGQNDYFTDQKEGLFEVIQADIQRLNNAGFIGTQGELLVFYSTSGM
tara:strand:- start:451 stop:687 length:237 start_codon:yes stop_codon:yes gene_type:complete